MLRGESKGGDRGKHSRINQTLQFDFCYPAYRKLSLAAGPAVADAL
jgi:hypothetical protein